jgi:hypothetical protein
VLHTQLSLALRRVALTSATIVSLALVGCSGNPTNQASMGSNQAPMNMIEGVPISGGNG